MKIINNNNMKKFTILIFIFVSLTASAQWTDISDKAYPGFTHPQMLDSLHIYCQSGDTVSPYKGAIIGTANGGKDASIPIN